MRYLEVNFWRKEMRWSFTGEDSSEGNFYQKEMIWGNFLQRDMIWGTFIDRYDLSSFYRWIYTMLIFPEVYVHRLIFPDEDDLSYFLQIEIAWVTFTCVYDPMVLLQRDMIWGYFYRWICSEVHFCLTYLNLSLNKYWQ